MRKKPWFHEFLWTPAGNAKRPGVVARECLQGQRGEQEVVSCPSRSPLYASRQSRGSPMRKMSFRATGSDTALETRVRRVGGSERKSKEIRIARGGAAARFVRIIVEDVSLLCPSVPFLFVPLSVSLLIYLARAFSRRYSARDRKSRREERRIGKRSERVRWRRSGPSIKTLKITEFLLVFRELCESPAAPRGRDTSSRITGDLLGKKTRVFGY